MTMTSIRVKPLTATDRCDRCGAQASVRATMHNGDLLFCAHDWRVNEEAVLKMTHDVLDERSKRFGKRKGSS